MKPDTETELIAPIEMPFNLIGELIDNSTTSEGESRARVQAENETRKAQTELF